MRNLFEHTVASWVKYSDYEYKEKNGILYLLPTEDAVPKAYDPMEDAKALVLKAMEIGLMCFRDTPDTEIRTAIKEFACEYGLLGLMTALPTTVKFIEYEKVYLPKNEYIRSESMDTQEYLDLFYPFRKPDFRKTGIESEWNEEEKGMAAIILAYQDYPQAVIMGFMRCYAERCDWLKAAFKNWCFQFMTTFLYYTDLEEYGEDAINREAFRHGLASFPSNAPTYHIELHDRPMLVWDFHSLLLTVQMLFALMVTDEATPLRMCRNCQKAFFAKRRDSVFCSAECRVKYSG